MKSLEPILQSLSFDPKVFLIQVVVFITLWVAMNYLFWKPMLAHLSQRDQAIRDAYKTQDAIQEEIHTLRSDYLARIAEIEAEARGRIQTAIKEAQTERERQLAEARAQSEATLKQGVADMEREKQQAIVELRERMVSMALNAADKALGSTADAVSLRRSIEAQMARDGGNGANPARN